MKHIQINKINIIILLVFVISLIFSSHTYAVDGAFSAAKDFLGKRKFSIYSNR